MSSTLLGLANVRNRGVSKHVYIGFVFIFDGSVLFMTDRFHLDVLKGGIRPSAVLNVKYISVC